MKQVYILFLVVSFSQVIYSQTTDNSIPLNVAYLNYNIDGHGLMISTERNINDKYVIEAALSAYDHENNDQTISFSAFFSRRLAYDSGFSPQFGVGLGLVNTWIENEQTQGQGIDVDERSGELSLATSIKVSPFAWDFRTKKDIPLRVFFDCILQAQFPEFESVDPYVLFQFGATYYFRYTSKNNEEE